MLMQHYKIDHLMMGIAKADLPDFILNIEKKELGIAAGLQDRVIQTYGGLVYMDFSIKSTIQNQQEALESEKLIHPIGGIIEESIHHNRYMSLDVKLMPHLYLAYNLAAGM